MNEAIALRERRVFTLRGPSLPRDPFEFTSRLLYNYYVCVGVSVVQVLVRFRGKSIMA